MKNSPRFFLRKLLKRFFGGQLFLEVLYYHWYETSFHFVARYNQQSYFELFEANMEPILQPIFPGENTFSAQIQIWSARMKPIRYSFCLLWSRCPKLEHYCYRFWSRVRQHCLQACSHMANTGLQWSAKTAVNPLRESALRWTIAMWQLPDL